MMSNWQRFDQLRLTHLPTGLSVTLDCEIRGRRSSPYHPAIMARARGWLAAMVHSRADPARPAPIRRTYTLAPAWAAGVRQDGRRLVAGGDAARTMLLDGSGLDRVILEARR